MSRIAQRLAANVARREAPDQNASAAAKRLAKHVARHQATGRNCRRGAKGLALNVGAARSGWPGMLRGVERTAGKVARRSGMDAFAAGRLQYAA
jgi:hypothetical protein